MINRGRGNNTIGNLILLGNCIPWLQQHQNVLQSWVAWSSRRAAAMEVITTAGKAFLPSSSILWPLFCSCCLCVQGSPLYSKIHSHIGLGPTLMTSFLITSVKKKKKERTKENLFLNIESFWSTRGWVCKSFCKDRIELTKSVLWNSNLEKSRANLERLTRTEDEELCIQGWGNWYFK